MSFFQDSLDYFPDIEACFIRCRGKSLLLNPKDWTLIEDWNERQIPLHLVLRTIEQCFKDNPEIYSLSYCGKAVEKAFAEYGEGQVGASQVEVVVITCVTCNDLKEISQTPVNAQYSWQLEFVPCPDCI